MFANNFVHERAGWGVDQWIFKTRLAYTGPLRIASVWCGKSFNDFMSALRGRAAGFLRIQLRFAGASAGASHSQIGRRGEGRILANPATTVGCPDSWESGYGTLTSLVMPGQSSVRKGVTGNKVML